MSIDRLNRRRASVACGCKRPGTCVIFGWPPSHLSRRGGVAAGKQDVPDMAKQCRHDLHGEVKILMKHAVDLKYRYAEEARREVCLASTLRCAVSTDGSIPIGAASGSGRSAFCGRGNSVALGEQNDRRQEWTKEYAYFGRASSSTSPPSAVLGLTGCGHAESRRGREVPRRRRWIMGRRGRDGAADDRLLEM